MRTVDAECAATDHLINAAKEAQDERQLIADAVQHANEVLALVDAELQADAVRSIRDQCPVCYCACMAPSRDLSNSSDARAHNVLECMILVMEGLTIA